MLIKSCLSHQLLIIELQVRSNFSSTSLHLAGLRLKLSELINFLHHMHNLQILDLANCQILQPLFVREFIHSSRDMLFVPMLKELKVTERTTCMGDDLILDMLEFHRSGKSEGAPNS